jgi:hypothetical protein
VCVSIPEWQKIQVYLNPEEQEIFASLRKEFVSEDEEFGRRKVSDSEVVKRMMIRFAREREDRRKAAKKVEP